MKTLARPLLALLAITPFLQARLEENLPATTYGLVKLESLGKTRKNIDGNPAFTALRSAGFSEYLKPLTDKLTSGDNAAKFAEFEKHRDELLAMLNGEVLFATVKTPEPESGHLPYDFILLADTDADEATVTEFLKKAGLHQPSPASGTPETKPAKPETTPQSEDDEEEDSDPTPTASTGARPRPVAPEIFAADEAHNGVTLHTLRVKVDEKPVTLSGWAIVDKTFVFATAPNVLRELVDARREGRKSNFTEQAVYKANRDALSDSDAWVLLNMPLIAGSLRDFVVANSRDEEGNATPGIMGMDTVKAYDSLALDAFSHIRVSFSLRPDDTRADSSVAWTENRGLVRLLTEPVTRGAEPDFTVLPSGVMAASAGRADLGKFIAVIESLLREALPLAAPMLDLQLDKVKNEQGLDIRGAVLANFGDEIWSVADPLPADGSVEAARAPSVLVFTLRDEAKFNSFIETLLGKVAAEQTGDGAKSLFDERELLGVKIRTVKNLPPTMPPIRYAVHKGRLFLALGEGRLLDRTLAQFKDPKGGLAADPAFKAGLDKLPRGASSVVYYDLGEYAATVGRAFTQGFKAAAAGKTDAPELDPAKAPAASALPFVAVGASVLHDKELSSRTVILRKPDANR